MKAGGPLGVPAERGRDGPSQSQGPKRLPGTVGNELSTSRIDWMWPVEYIGSLTVDPTRRDRAYFTARPSSGTLSAFVQEQETHSFQMFRQSLYLSTEHALGKKSGRIICHHSYFR